MSIPQSCGERDKDHSGYFLLKGGGNEYSLESLVSSKIFFFLIYNYLNLMKPLSTSSSNL